MITARKASNKVTLIEFKDANGKACSIQVSSAIMKHVGAKRYVPIDEQLWLGCNEGRTPEPNFSAGRMHLTREQVEIIRDHLTAWLATGSLMNDGE